MAAPAGSSPAAPNKALQGGVVRSCPSGDTVVVRPRGVVTPGAERTIHIAGIAAPRLGSRERDDDVSTDSECLERDRPQLKRYPPPSRLHFHLESIFVSFWLEEKCAIESNILYLFRMAALESMHTSFCHRRRQGESN